MYLRVIAVVAAVLLVSACVTVKNTLTSSEVASFRLTGVNVTFAQDVKINWVDGIFAYGKAKGIAHDDLLAASATEEAKAYVRGLLGTRVKEAMERQVSGALMGSRPIRVEVTVRNFEISGAVQRIVIGGGYSITADVTLVDAKSGATLVAYPNLVYAVPALQGWGGAIVQAAYDAGNPPAERLVNGFAETYRDWLLKKS